VPAPPVPTARNVDHFACTVPDLDLAVAAFADVFDARLLYRQGPVADPDGDFMARQLAVHPRASCHVALLRLGPTANIELFSYRAPGRRTRWPAPGEAGAHAPAFLVEDLAAALRWVEGRPDLVVLPDRPRVAGSPAARALATRWGMRLVLAEAGAPQAPPAAAPQGWAPALPGLLGLGQVSYTVGDFEGVLGFFTGTLGGTLLPGHGPADGGADGDGVRTATLRLGPTATVELRAGRTDRPRPRNSDIGGHHLALWVEDVPRAAAALARADGARLLGKPQVIDEGGPIDGAHWQYFTGPDGFQFELTHAPAGLPYEARTADRRYGPAPSWHPA
jgi:catechol 2,3-dioxygenase-like lactoylglutathione lyase family enzyme